MWIPITNQANPSFMNQGGWLESLSRSFLGHVEGGEATEFLVNKIEQLVGGVRFALFHCSIPGVVKIPGSDLEVGQLFSSNETLANVQSRMPE